MKAFNLYVNIHNWKTTKNDWLGFLSLISSTERMRIARYLFKKNSKQTTIGQVLIKYSIEKVKAQSGVKIILARNEYGKPYIENCRTLFEDSLIDFNLSHSESFVIISVIYDVPIDNAISVGCDVMKVNFFHNNLNTLSPEELSRKQIEQFFSIIENEFTENEKIFINLGKTNIDKLVNFYRIWCLKESYIKSIGKGLYFGLRRINCVIKSCLNLEVKNRSVTDTKVLIDEKEVNVQFSEQIVFNTDAEFPDNIYILTVCMVSEEENDFEIKQVPFEQISIQNLIEHFHIPKSIVNSNLNNQDEMEKYWVQYLKQK